MSKGNSVPSGSQPVKGGESDIDKSLNEVRATISQLKFDIPKVKTPNIRFVSSQKPVPIDEKIRKQKIENDIKEKDQRLKERTLVILFVFLSAETFIVFLLAFIQGFKLWKFTLDEWSFRLVVAGTLGQIATMLTIAVKHLFPKK